MKEVIVIDEAWEVLRNSRVERVSSLWDDENVFESVSVMEMCDDVNEVWRDLEGFNFRGEWFLGGQDKNGDETFEREVDLEL